MSRAIPDGRPEDVAAAVALAWGDVPERRASAFHRFRRQTSREIAGLPPGLVLGMALELKLAHGLRGLACSLIRCHAGAFARVDRRLLEQLGEGMDTWWAVDGFARLLSGPAWLHGSIGDEAVMDWAGSDDLWWRRAALVSTVALNMRSQGGYGDTRRTLMVCGPLVGDREDMVVKAMSWALRELVVHDPAAVGSFLDRHCSTLAARVRREVRNKLKTGLKNPRRAVEAGEGG
ncbi:DNA alkylation repair protein [Candidatus Fermentibacterales bacterium]|nr:DNA alkylation repair protein [Candidatus Fermentibacterales bacterium]